MPNGAMPVDQPGVGAGVGAEAHVGVAESSGQRVVAIVSIAAHHSDRRATSDRCRPRIPSGAWQATDRRCRSRCSTTGCWCKLSKEDGERTSTGGILIPATAQIAKRLVWGEVVALGPNVRSAEAGDKVLFSPDDRYEVEVQGEDYIMLRERDLHAVAAKRIEASTGLYL